MIGILTKWNRYPCDPPNLPRTRTRAAAAPRCWTRHPRAAAGRLLVLALVGTLHAAPGGAQQPAGGKVEADAIRCWWRTSAGAVQIGETVSVVLTCAALDNDAVQVVPDETQLDPATVQMAPFEVIGGARPPDQRTADRRFFQRVYTLRIINPDVIGKDVQLPPLSIRYRVHNRLAAQASVEGRELVYLLPLETIRVISVVPPEAIDIRDAVDETFDAISQLAFRGGVLRLVGGGLMALGAVMAVVALVRLATGRRTKPKTDARLLPEGRVLNAVLRELSAVRQDAEPGWTDVLVSRALAALRVAAACALGRLTQLASSSGAQGPEGHLTVQGGWRRGPTTVCSAVTAEDVERELARLPDDGSPPVRRQLLSELQNALATLTEGRYGRNRLADRDALDQALSAGAAAVKRLASAQAWPRRYFAPRLRPATEVEHRA